MPVVTFWNGTDEQCGTTSSAIAFATHVAIEHNIRILFISTSLNDSIIKDSFWKEKKKSTMNIFGANNNNIERNGVEGLDRVIRSNKVTPDVITDYSKIVLTNRLEILLGVEGTIAQYELIKDKYSQIIELASKFYDLVVVDLDRKVGPQSEVDILKKSDVVVAMISQRAKQIKKIQEMLDKGDIIKKENTVLTIGKYMENTKYNAKNITRNLLKKKDEVNTIPYNNLFFEATQEGKVIDLFLTFMRITEKDENYIFVSEIKRLYETIQIKIRMQQMRGG